ncbi:MAG: hypothetical protein QM536_01980 [Chitinophagaceae bacterium]|nr:hypothetical protein [Chitinophagaceae bacterium]
MKTYIYIFISIMLMSCATKNQKENLENNIPASLQKCLDYYGGVSTWKSFKSVEFDIEKEHHIIDLETRKVFISTHDSSYSIGFDGKNVWVSPNMQIYGGTHPRFYHNLHFYFFSFPFILTDPGIKYTSLPEKTFQNTLYTPVSIKYEHNVGDSPQDEYILYIQKENGQLDFINYTATYFTQEASSQYNALVYDTWQEIQNIKVPRNYTFYKWSNDTIQESRGSVLFENVIFKNTYPDSNLFVRPMISELDTVLKK